VKVLSVGDIPLTSEQAPDGTGEVFSPSFGVFGLTYARQMTDRVNFGGTVSYVNEKILQETAAGMAFDFGFQYETGYQGVRLGMAMKNFGANLEYSGSDFERNLQIPGDDPQSGNRTVSSGSAAFELPSSFQFGMSYPVMRGANALNLYGLYQNNSYAVDDGRLGAEWMYSKQGALRLGYMFNSNESDLFGFSYGLGLGSDGLFQPVVRLRGSARQRLLHRRAVLRGADDVLASPLRHTRPGSSEPGLLRRDAALCVESAQHDDLDHPLDRHHEGGHAHVHAVLERPG
jgi:hypothetical protein